MDIPISRSVAAAQADPEVDSEFAAKVLAPLQQSLALAPPNLALSPSAVPAMSPSFASIISSLSPAPVPSQPPSSLATPRQSNGSRLPSIAAKAGASVLSPPMSARHASLTSPPLSARPGNLLSPRLELQQEPYVVYDNVQMVSDLETKLVMVYYPVHYTLEVVCVVQGVQEGNTLRLFLDYRMIYAALLQSDFVSRAKKRRRQLLLDFLLPRLKIVRGVDAWSLSLDNPRERRYRRYDGTLSTKCSVNSKKIDDSSFSNRSVTTRRMLANSDDSTKGEDEEMLLHRKEKELDEKLLKELNKLIVNKPPQLPALDIQAYFATKEERGLQFLDHFVDLPLLHSSVLKVSNPVTNFLGRAWMCADDIDDLLEAYWTIEFASNPSAQTGSRRNSHRLAHNGLTGGDLLLNEGETFARTNILLETMESKKNDSRTKLPKIDFSSSSADSRSSSVAATSSSSSLSSTLMNLLHPKKNAGGEKHVYDFFASGSGSVASGNMFRRSPDAHEDLGLVPSDMASASFDLAKSESGSGKSGRSRRRTLNSADPSMDNIPRTSVRYRYGTNSLAALSIDERGPALHGSTNSSNLTPTARDRTQRRTFGMDPLLPGHFSTPGGSALAAAAMGLPFSSAKKPLQTPTPTK